MAKKEKQKELTPNKDTLEANGVMVAKQGLLGGFPEKTCSSADINEPYQRPNRKLEFIPKKKKKT